MTMSLHKLTAGDGYTYLTRQVAAHDRATSDRTSLASYYTEKGETPGVWTGSGLVGVVGLRPGDEVTAEQMQALFGAGLHPLAGRLRERLEGPGLTEQDYQGAVRLGAPFKVYPGDVAPLTVQVARRLEEYNAALGHPRDYPVPEETKARIRTEVAAGLFHTVHGRAPRDARELAGQVAKASRPRSTAVAGYDLTFSPVKSVSALWALAPREVAAQVEQAHHAAVSDALAFIEDHVLYTREGTNGVRQVEVTGLVAARFTHRDSRAGDPDLHTHVAVSNKVQARQSGKWLAIDGRPLHTAVVAASETYNTRLEAHLRDRLGLAFAERPGTDRSKRPIREVVGVDPHLNQAWSQRRRSIEARRSQLTGAFQRDHGRPPTVVESIQLAQQATLETREAKHEPRTLDEQRTAWRAQAEGILGGPDGVAAMMRVALSAGRDTVPFRVDSAWVQQAATRVLAQVQARRSTWQVWHVRAEADRQIRPATLTARDVDTVLDLVVDAALEASVRLSPAGDGITEPEVLRRSDGASMYEVAGAPLFTSREVLAAEQRLVASAGLAGRHAATEQAVTVTLLEQAANHTPLNAGQSALVRSMATSGAALQLAIAPAGAGKTTAMRALTTAWAEDGGTVIGLAPSAAAAAVLRESTGAATDTLAKLVHSLNTGDLPEWADQIGPRTLVVVDEAGMADTISLDTAVAFVLNRGGQVRLIGDDQQLAAIGAGGVLRDIAHTHGALHLSQLMRFTDPAEGAASLALRDGRPEALGFYLDNDRVHVGDLATTTDAVFTAWARDGADGRDAIMLAPTRDLVAELNKRAQAHRMTQAHRAGGTNPGPGVPLADGNLAHVGDTVVTRTNDRRLRLTATDWVKNGDRWTVHATRPDGSLAVRHARTGLRVALPAAYVTGAVELGYATTVHAAQGVSVDTMHGLATGAETRQQLYTMLTRGSTANHVYLQVVGDGDPHQVLRPESTHPPTATDLLEGVLARDDAPRSATTLARDLAAPAPRLGAATPRYVDALHLAAEIHLGAAAAARLEKAAHRIVPGIGDDPAWPTLRNHLILLAANGTDPTTALAAAASSRELDTAGDRAAVLDWRLDDAGLRGAGRGPLPWLPAIPATLTEHPQWGPYLTARATLVRDLAAQVRAAATASGGTPSWWTAATPAPGPEVLGDLTVWRAATGTPDSDHRPTGTRQQSKALALWQRALDARVGTDSPALAEWGATITRHVPAVAGDTYLPQLAERLAAISRAGINAHALLRTAAGAPLPDDHPASALWWRISRHLTPAVAHHLDTDTTLTPAWTGRLAEQLGEQRTAAMQASPWWPALVATIDHALARGHHLETLLTGAGAHDPGLDVDETPALTWRLSLLTGPLPHDDSTTPPPEDDTHDVDTDRGWLPPVGAILEAPAPGHEPDAATTAAAPFDVDAMLAAAALARTAMGVLPPSDAEIEQAVAHAAEWDHAPFTPARAAQINGMAADYYAGLLEAGWAGDYLRGRLRTDTIPTGAGYAPPGWTHLVDHLHGRGVNDDELLAVGLASAARTGRLIDRFRDRLVLPIIDGDTVVGFVARRHPDAGEDHGPKYLNTPATPLFHKGDVLYGWNQQALDHGAVPVLVEGPFDALAVTAAAGDRYLGVAPLGTSLTQTQARLLAGAHHSPIVALDNDRAGQVAAERTYWLLAQHATTPLSVALPAGADPASLLHERGPESLAATLNGAHALAQDLLDARAAHVPTHELPATAAAVIAADHPEYWRARAQQLAARCGLDVDELFADVAVAGKRWATEPAAESARHIGVADVRSRAPSHSPVCEVHRATPVPVCTSPRADGTAFRPRTNQDNQGGVARRPDSARSGIPR